MKTAENAKGRLSCKRFVVAGGKKHQRKPTFFILDSAYFRETQKVDVEFK